MRLSIGPETRLEEVAEVSQVPAKGVFTQKPITNRLRARTVGCRDFLGDQGKDSGEKVEGAKGVSRLQELYAGGMDGTIEFRCVSRLGATGCWTSRPRSS